MWERFSFYGMSALLTLYMVKELLLPANAAQVIGLAGLRGLKREFGQGFADQGRAHFPLGRIAQVIGNHGNETGKNQHRHPQ